MQHNFSISPHSEENFEEESEDFSDDARSRRIWHYIFVSIALFGIFANIGLFWRRKKSTRRSSSTTKTSLFLLTTMAAADTVCLLALLFMLTQRYFRITDPWFLNMVCKLDLFIIHTTSAFSIWCWLVLSAVRYVAVYRPYTHLRLNREPRIAVIFVAVFCCFIESWVLFDIEYDPVQHACMSSSPESLSKKLQICEIIVSYFLPVAILTVLDMKVLLCRAIWYDNKSKTKLKEFDKTLNEIGEGKERKRMLSSSIHTNNNNSTGLTTSDCAFYDSNKSTLKCGNLEEQSQMKRTKSKKRIQQMRVLRRCLCITIFDLSMNLPNYLLRLYLTVISEEDYRSLNMEVVGLVENLSQIMYFAQFALNALYLVCIIYDTPRGRAKIPVSSQVSSAYLSITPRQQSMKRSFRCHEGAGLMV